MTESVPPVWLSHKEQEELRQFLAEQLDNAILTPLERDSIEQVLVELGVATTRYRNSTVPGEKLRVALGKPNGSIPLHLSKDELLVTISHLPTQSLLKEKLVNVTI